MRRFTRVSMPNTANSSEYRSCGVSESRTAKVASRTKGIFFSMRELGSARMTKEPGSRSFSQYISCCSAPSSKTTKSSLSRFVATAPLSSKTITGICTNSTLVTKMTFGRDCADDSRDVHTAESRARNKNMARFFATVPAPQKDWEDEYSHKAVLSISVSQ